MQIRTDQAIQGARQLAAKRTHPSHTHLTDLLGFLLAFLFICTGGPYAYAGETPAKPDIDAIRTGKFLLPTRPASGSERGRRSTWGGWWRRDHNMSTIRAG